MTTRLQLERYLPLSLAATLSVLVLPALLAARFVPPHGALSTLASGALAVLVSLLLATVEAAAWKGRRRRSDLVFAELLVWGLVRRWWTERRLDRLSASYERAASSELTVRVELLEAIARLLEARSPYTYGHCRRVAHHAEKIARALRLTPPEVATIRTAALVHDVGKVYTPPELLQKTQPLSETELEILARHSTDGARMLEPVKDPALAAIVRHHHERVGGRGYPDGLIGEEIPLGARIVAVADAFDVLTSRRPHRPASSQREALEIIEAEAGLGLDRRVVDAFLESCSARRSVLSFAFLTAVSERLTGVLQLPSGLGTATTAGSAAQLLPALGAVGVLALVPGGGHGRGDVHGTLPPAAALRAQLPSGSSSALARSGAPERSDGVARPGHTEGAGRRNSSSSAPQALAPNDRRTSGGRSPEQPVTGTAQPAPSSESEAQSASRSSSSGSSSTPSAPSGHEEAPGTTQEAPPPPPQQAPAITTPAITTPAISTPAISLPPVKLPPLNVPAVTVPPVTIPSITLPSLKLPLGG